MNIQEVIKHLDDIDKGCGFNDIGFYNCGVKQINDNTFTYAFDGWMICEVEFFPDGSVRENVEDMDHLYTSIEAWKTKLIEINAEYRDA